MKTNLYYHSVFRRQNTIKIGILSFFLAIASWPRLLLEVFVRKNFGERYFSMATSVILFLILACFPMFRGFSHNYGYGDDGFWSNMNGDPSWYLFLIAFLVVSTMRYLEIKREPSVFDFAKFSLSTGVINPLFYRIKIFGKNPSSRTISTLIEPAFFFIIGLILLLFKQNVGSLIIVCSLCYSFGYYGSYYMGDEFIMDQIDEMICNEEMMSSFVDEEVPADTRGVEIYGRRPSNHDMRRKIAGNFIVDNYDGAIIK